MKVRKGFVSNSSSSSYLIPMGTFKDVFDLAAQMITIRDKEWGGEEDQSEWAVDFRKKPSLVAKLAKLQEQGMDPNTPVHFHTCNYNTWILRTDEGFLVDTCNNHDWYDLMQGANAKWADNHHDLLPRYAYPENDSQREIIGDMRHERYYFLEMDFFGTVAIDPTSKWSWSKRCQRMETMRDGRQCGCFGTIVIRDDGQEFCPRCAGLGDV